MRRRPLRRLLRMIDTFLANLIPESNRLEVAFAS